MQTDASCALDVQVTVVDVIKALIVHHGSDILVLQQYLRIEHQIVWLAHCSGRLRACPYCERQLGLLAVVNSETFEHKAGQT